jgi:octaprenyl-diphosphate synthase
MKLTEILAPVSGEMKRIEEELSRITAQVGNGTVPGSSGDGILGRIVTHPFTIPGKRIRPALVLLSSRTAGASGFTETHIRLAAAVELLHAASLVHDDVIDGAYTRRHQLSLNKRFGNRIAVLAGDILYTGFFSLVTGLDSVSGEIRLALLDLFLDTTRAMCLGEILAQEAYRSAKPIDFDDYMSITRDKTAVLFSACCRSAAMVSGADAGTAAALGELGISFGILFQMADDLQDRDHRLDPSIDLASKTGEYAERTRKLIMSLPPSTYRDALGGLVDFIVSQIVP